MNDEQNTELEKLIAEVANKLINNQVNLDPDFSKILYENYWELLE